MTIKLNNGLDCLVDEKNYPMLSQFNWTCLKRKNTYYAHASKNGTRILMHRLIMNAEKGTDVDHINHSGLDNREVNLRVCSRAQNVANSQPRKNSTSKYKGVHKHVVKRGGKINTYWVASIWHNKKSVQIICFLRENLKQGSRLNLVPFFSNRNQSQSQSKL